MNLIDTAKEFNELGIAVVPFDANKRPMRKGWTSFTAEDQKDKLSEVMGNAPMMGVVIPKGYEVLDIDSKNALTGDLNKRFVQLLRLYDPKLFAKLVLQTTMNDGLHFFYACNKALPSRKLASRQPTEEEAKQGIRAVVLIETRGIGGSAIVSPSEGYSLINNNFSKIPFITNAEHETLISISKSFHERVKETISPKDAKGFLSGSNKPSWEGYNEHCNYITTGSVLEDAGWKVLTENDSNIYYTRPGKTDGISGDLHKDKNIFKAWTTNSNFDSDKWYDAFGVLTICNYGGDFSLAAIELLKKGFGESFAPDQPLENEVDEFEMIIKEIYAKQFDYNATINLPDPILYVDSNGSFRAGYKGSLVGIVGREKSMKTTIAKGLAASGLDSGKKHLNFRLFLGGKKILWFETEQSTDRWQKGIREIYSMAGLDDNSDQFKSFSLRKYPSSIRREAFLHIVQKEKDVGMVILDGVVDIVKDFNDFGEAAEILTDIMELCDSGIMLVYLLHLTKSAGHMRGALGTELANKSDLVIKAELNEEDENISTVSCLLSKEMRFGSYEITRDIDGVPIIFDPNAIPPLSAIPVPPPDGDGDNNIPW
jgi:hypothetical protein